MSYTSTTQQYKRLRGDEDPTKVDSTFTDISIPLSLPSLPQQITSDDLHPPTSSTEAESQLGEDID